MENIKKIKEYWRKKVDSSFVEFIEYLENDLKPFAELVDYNYIFSKDVNYHIYNFNLTKEITDAEVAIINSIINTYDEGTITSGVIHFGSIYVTIYGDS